LATGFWQDLHELRNKSAIEKVFEPKMPSEQAELIYKGWLKAVKRSQNWAED
ncbi:glycerol kinase, partial [Acinetobacter baumannii]